MKRITLSAVVALSLTGLMVCTGCASSPRAPGAAPSRVPEPTSTQYSGAEHGIDEIAQPDGFVIRYDQTELHVRPHTYCYTGGCVDGFDPDPASVGDAAELFVFISDPGLDQLTASQLTRDGDCIARSVAADVSALGDGWWQVTPVGPADEYEVELFAAGDAGDMIASVGWTTTLDRPLPAVQSHIVIVADHDGVPDSYGVDLSVQNLEDTPIDATATITVTSAEGAAHTFRATRLNDGCAVGSLSFNGPHADGRAAAALGGYPFTYRVELELDGVTHVATAEYDGGDADIYVPLEFSPSLR